MARTNGTSWTDKKAGIGNPDDYFYIVRAIDRTRLNDSNTDKAAKLVIQLDEGAHLVSIPLELANTSIEHILQTLDYDMAWFYNGSDALDPWKSHNPYRVTNDRTSINRSMGFWVSVSQDTNITLAGRVPTSTDILLRAGWNLVGYPSFIERNVSVALSGISYERVEGYVDAPSQNLKLMSDTDLMRPCEGYWIKVNSETTWIIGN